MSDNKQKKPRNERIIYTKRNLVEVLARIGLTVLIWLIIGFFVLFEVVVLRRFGVPVPAIGYAFPLSVLLVMTFIIWNKYGWDIIKQEKMDSINQQIQAQLAELSDEELEEVRRGIRQIPVELGFGVSMGHKLNSAYENKNIEDVISRLSDDELRDLRERLWQKDMSDSELQQIITEKHTQRGE